MKEGKRQSQDIRSVKGNTPESFIKQLPISGKKSTSQSTKFNTTNQVKVTCKVKGR